MQWQTAGFLDPDATRAFEMNCNLIFELVELRARLGPEGDERVWADAEQTVARVLDPLVEGGDAAPPSP